MVKINVDKSKNDNSKGFVERRRYINVIPDELPVLPLRNAVMFPYTVLSISVGQPGSIRLIQQLPVEQQLIAIVAYKDTTSEKPTTKQLCQIGCIAQILSSQHNENDGSIQLLLQGVEKINIDKWTAEEPFFMAKISKHNDIEPNADDLETQVIRSNLTDLFNEYDTMTSYLPMQLLESVSHAPDYRHFVYLISASIHLNVKEAQDILEQDDVITKMLKLTDYIHHEMEVFQLGKKIQDETRSSIDKSQREYLLREQLKSIRKELGEESCPQIKIEEYEKVIKTSGMSIEAKQKANFELKRLERISEASAEYNVTLSYLDWLTSLPWKHATKDNFDRKKAKKILDQNHYGLEKIKTRILEYIAIRQLKKQRKSENQQTIKNKAQQIIGYREGVILCLVGPPGIGKTSLGLSIALSLGRKFQRISLGGVRDEAEIRGHRKTYVGSMPGRLINALCNAKTKNPVFLLDEVDKLGQDMNGDPSSALLEVLDPEQNKEFRDHYLEVAFDLSQVIFIATANVAENIPGPLLDRMELLRISGYTDEEKLHISQNHLLKKQKQENSLRTDELMITDSTYLKIIREYTREAGVRELNRKLGTICRKVASKIVDDDGLDTTLKPEDLENYLGKPMYSYDIADRTKAPGVSTALAVTAVGGEILFVEVCSMLGKKGLTITGQLGDVMRESIETALSYVRSRAKYLHIDNDFFETKDIHFHLPAGAIPKDGPSAGIALVVALVSLLTERPVRRDVGMTGEITLRGLVLPVGGVKDKILAAQRAQLNTVILPKSNEKDLDELPESVHKSMRFELVENLDEVLKIVFR